MPAKSVYLHAGLPKTGTSAIQKTAFEHRKALERAGIRYWGVAARQSWPLTIALGLTEDERGGVPESRSQGYQIKFGHPAELRDSLIAEIETAPDTFVISSEKISVFSVDTLVALGALVGAGGAEVKAIAYIREPRSLISSAVQQNAKVGIPTNDVLDRLEVLPYQGRVGRLIEAFGEENVLLRLYRRGGPGRDSLFADFLRAIGGDPGLAEGLPMDESNSSMSARATNILDAVNRIARKENCTAPTNWFRRKYLLPHFQGPAFQVDPAVVERLIDQNREQIDWMSARLGTDLLTVAPPPLEPQPQPEPIDGEMARLIYSLFADLAEKRAEVRRAEAASLTADNRGEEAKRSLALAERRQKRVKQESGRISRVERLALKSARTARKEERGARQVDRLAAREGGQGNGASVGPGQEWDG